MYNNIPEDVLCSCGTQFQSRFPFFLAEPGFRWRGTLEYGFSQGAETIGPAVVEEVLREKARFGVMGRPDLPRGAAGQSAAGWGTDLAEERPSRPPVDEASRAVLAAMCERKK